MPLTRFIFLEYLIVVIFLGSNKFFLKEHKIVLCSLLSTASILNLFSNNMELNLFILLFLFMLEIFFTYLYTKSSFLSLFFVLLQSSFLILIWTITYDIPAYLRYEYSEYREISPLVIFIQFSLLITLVYLFRFFDQEYNIISSFKFINKEQRTVSLGIVMINIFLFLIRQVLLIRKSVLIFYLSLILIVFSTLLIFILISINKNYQNRLELDTLSRSSQILKEQTVLYQEFRHDYNSFIYSTLGYIKNNDLAGAKNYLLSLQEYSSPLLEENCYLKIQAIPNLAIQGILIDCANRCIENNLIFYLNVQNFPESLDIQLIDFIRCFSILLNNAVEHSSDKVYVSLMGNNSNLEVVVENTYSQPVDLAKFFTRNYTSKVDHAGIGLTIFLKIIKKYQNLSYSVTAENNTISFTLLVKKLEML